MAANMPAPYTTEERKAATFDEVATRVGAIIGDSSEFGDALEAFRGFLASQENATLSKYQLQVLKCQSIFSLEECANRVLLGGIVSEVLFKVTRILLTVSRGLSSMVKWQDLLQDQDGTKNLETLIDDAFNGLEREIGRRLERSQAPVCPGMHSISERALTNLLGTIVRTHLAREGSSEVETATRFPALELDPDTVARKGELLSARRKDQKHIAELREALAQISQSIDNLEMRAKELMDRYLKIIGDPTATSQPPQDVKRALAILAELTGESLPASTLLGKEFVTIGSQAIHLGTSYDVCLGEYFTGEQLAIKMLRHRMDAHTAKMMHGRFARQAVNWSALRHNALLPFYGIGVASSTVAPGEFQLYMVSPYLRNRDAKRYLKKYNKISLHARLQLALDVARGLHHMHGTHEMIHSALNIFNVLIKDSGRAVISGFGHAKILKDRYPQETFFEHNSEYRYMAPELMQDDAFITYGTDIYSWSMTALEASILTDVSPFGAKTKGPKIIQMVTHGQKPARRDHPMLEEYPCSDELWSLFEACWDMSPSARPLAGQLIQRLEPLIHEHKPTSWISSHMPASEIVECLAYHNCPDVTDQLEVPACTQKAMLGGGYGDIYQGSLRTGLKVAIKCPRIYGGQDDDHCHGIVKRFAHEMYAASKLRHPNIVEVIGVAHFRSSVAIISPWMENGAVTTYIEKNPHSNRCKLCTQIASGLSYMHQKEIVHGDLKGVNILVSSDGIAQITDFGNTILEKYTLQFTGTQAAGSALEILENETGVSRPADVYALGMTILEITTGKLPFDGMLEPAVIGAIFRQKLPLRPQDSIPAGTQDGDKLWAIITRCWAKKPSERPSATEVEAIMRTITPEGLSKKRRRAVFESDDGNLATPDTSSPPANRARLANPASIQHTTERALGVMYALGVIE